MDIVLLVGSLAIILIAAELFTNGIEWVGHKLNLRRGRGRQRPRGRGDRPCPRRSSRSSRSSGRSSSAGRATEAAQAVGVGAILGCAVHALDAGDVRHAASPSSSSAGAAGAPPTCASTRGVLGRDVAFFVVGYAIAIGTAFLPQELALAEVGGRGDALRALCGLRAPALHRRRRGEHRRRPGPLHITRVTLRRRTAGCSRSTTSRARTR